MNKKILRAKETEITRAGKLVFDAIFGESKDFEKHVAELEEEATAPPADPNAIQTSGYTVVRCDACNREAILPANVDLRALEQVGWRRVRDDAWRCATCGGSPSRR
jgi:uncharacterized protein with PIN domain